MFDVDRYSITNITDIETQLGWSPFTRGLLIAYNVLIIILSLSGNGIVLYGSLKHNAIKIDRVSLMFIQNLAVSDILITFLYYVPTLVTLSAKKWVLGSEMCFISAFFFNVPIFSEILIIVSLSCYRLWMLKKPPAVRAKIQMKPVKITMGVIVFLSFCPGLSAMLYNHAHFDPRYLNCIWHHCSNDKLSPYVTIVVGLCVFAPMIILITANVIIIYIVAKSSGKIGRSATPNRVTVLTLTSICWTFIISYGPVTIDMVLYMLDFRTPTWFQVLIVYTLSVNVTANPIIYTMRNSRFRRYVASLSTVNINRGVILRRNAVVHIEGDITVVRSEGEVTVIPTERETTVVS